MTTRTVLALLLLGASTAHAQVWGDPYAPPAPVPVPAPAPVPAPVSPYAPPPTYWGAPAPAPVSPVSPTTTTLSSSATVGDERPARARVALDDDPAADRAWLSPTPETQRRGSWTYNNYEFIVHGLTYGVTDNLQVTGFALPMYAEGTPSVFGVSAKLRVLPRGPLRLAVTGSLWTVDPGVDSLDDPDVPNTTVITAGGTAALCLDAGCISQLGANVDLIGIGNDDADDDTIRTSAYASIRMSRRMKLLAELSRGRIGTDDLELADDGLLMLGVRFTSAHVSTDLGLAMPMNFADDDPDTRGAFPALNLTYRP